MRKHVVEMDVARALATIAVIVIHVTAVPLVANPAGSWVTLFYLVFNIAARFAVPAFVVLSGAGLSLSDRHKEGYIPFLKARFSKLVPIYLIWCVVYAVAFNPHQSLPHFLIGVLTGQANYHLYFVPLIIMLYLLFPPLHRAMKSVWGLGFFALLTFCALYINSFVGYPGQLRFLVFAANPLNWLFYMAVGVWLAKPEVMEWLTDGRFRHLSTAAFVLCMGAMVALAWRLMLGGAPISVALAWISLLMMPYTVLFFVWVYKHNWGGRSLGCLQWISRHSFAIYLSHPLLLTPFYLHVYSAIGTPNGISYGLSGFIVALTGSATLSTIGEKAKRIIFRH